VSHVQRARFDFCLGRELFAYIQGCRLAYFRGASAASFHVIKLNYCFSYGHVIYICKVLFCVYSVSALSTLCLLGVYCVFSVSPLFPWSFHSLHLPSTTLVSLMSHVVHLFPCRTPVSPPIYWATLSFVCCWIVVFFPLSCVSCVYLILPVSTLPACP